jgi:hypothetical protein
MKTKILKLAVFVLILAGSFACEKNDINISNIEDLYAQPLSVIQKTVQGKWKWITYINGIGGYIPFDMGLVEITKDKIISYNKVQNFYWQEQQVYVNSVAELRQTYVACNKQDDFPICCFEYIKNDTMEVRGFGHQSIFSAMERNIFIKIKND